MLNWLHQKFDSRERRTGRNAELRSHCRFERLEPRAMLTAAMGQMPIGPGELFLSHAAHDGPPFATAGVMSLPHAHADRPESGIVYRSEPGPAFGARQTEPGGTTGSYMGGLQDGNSNAISSPPPAIRAIVQIPRYSPTISAAQELGTTYVIVIVQSTPQPVDYLRPPSSSIIQSPPKSSAITAPSTNPPTEPPKSSAIRAPSSATPSDLPPGGGQFSSNSGIQLPQSANVPSAMQIASRDIDSAALAPSTALDSAFQSYAARLLLTTATSAKESSQLALADDETAAHAIGTADFIRQTDSTAANDGRMAGNAIERDEAALEEVLRGLEDWDESLLDKSSNSDLAADAESEVTDSAWDTLAFSPDSFDGMVMIRAGGSTNNSNINLAGLAESPPEPEPERTRVETSIGFYQAMDVATDVLPVRADVSAATPVTEPARSAEQTERPGQQSSSSSPKAAAATSVTTLIGAMLWVSHLPRKTKRRAPKSDDGHRGNRVPS